MIGIGIDGATLLSVVVTAWGLSSIARQLRLTLILVGHAGFILSGVEADRILAKFGQYVGFKGAVKRNNF